MPVLPRKQSTRKRKFVESYCISLNATKAALECGFVESNAHNSGYQMLKKADVQAMIAAKLNECTITKERTLREIGRLAYSDPGALFDEFGNLRPIHTLDEATRATIASVEVIKKNMVAGDGEMDEVHKVKQWDKTKALEMAAKYLKLLDGDKSDTNVTIQVSWMQPQVSSEPGAPTINVTPEKKRLSE